jgi:hypothetical protein
MVIITYIFKHTFENLTHIACVTYKDMYMNVVYVYIYIYFLKYHVSCFLYLLAEFFSNCLWMIIIIIIIIYCHDTSRYHTEYQVIMVYNVLDVSCWITEGGQL